MKLERAILYLWAINSMTDAIGPNWHFQVDLFDVEEYRASLKVIGDVPIW